MVKRSIIKIDDKKCDGCALCIPNCPEGAIQMIDGKARLISDLFCDGLGACIGHCPQGAIEIEKRDAEPYNEIKTMKNIIPHGENTIRAHLEHLEEHGETKFLEQAINILKEKGIKIKRNESPIKPTPCSCPSMQMQDLTKKKKFSKKTNIDSELQQWPVQLSLLTPYAPFFENSDLLVCADCVPFAYANLHQELLKDKRIVVGCPKFDDVQEYKERLTEIFKNNNIKSVTVAIMEVPCCEGLLAAVESAIRDSGKNISLNTKIVGVSGEID